MRRLDAGSTEVGTPFPLIVASDVRAKDGTVVIRQGTPAVGTVVASRSEGSLSALMNRPARLEVTLDETRAVDGQTVRLRIPSGEKFAFTRANTGRPEPSSEVLRALEDPANAAAWRAFEGLFSQNPQLDSGTREAVRQLTELLPEGSRPKTADGKDDPLAFVAKLQSGGLGAALADPSGSLASVVALANLAGSVGGELERKLAGRTIRAHVGTPVEALIAGTMTVRPPELRNEGR